MRFIIIVVTLLAVTNRSRSIQCQQGERLDENDGVTAACGSSLLLPYCYQPFAKLSVRQGECFDKKYRVTAKCGSSLLLQYCYQPSRSYLSAGRISWWKSGVTAACGSSLLLHYCYQPFGKLSVSRANVLMKIWGYCGIWFIITVINRSQSYLSAGRMFWWKSRVTAACGSSLLPTVREVICQ